MVCVSGRFDIISGTTDDTLARGILRHIQAVDARECRRRGHQSLTAAAFYAGEEPSLLEKLPQASAPVSPRGHWLAAFLPPVFWPSAGSRSQRARLLSRMLSLRTPPERVVLLPTIFLLVEI